MADKGAGRTANARLLESVPCVLLSKKDRNPGGPLSFCGLDWRTQILTTTYYTELQARPEWQGALHTEATVILLTAATDGAKFTSPGCFRGGQ